MALHLVVEFQKEGIKRMVQKKCLKRYRQNFSRIDGNVTQKFGKTRREFLEMIEIDKHLARLTYGVE